MLRTFLQWAALAVAAMAGAGSAGAQPLARVALDAHAIAAGGIRTVALQAVRRAARVAAFGTILDPGPLITLSARIAAARARLEAAQAATALAHSEQARAVDLYRTEHNISQAAYQAAQSHLLVAQATQASAQVGLDEALARARADWGARLATAAARGAAPLPQLERGIQQIVEVSLPLGQALRAAPGAAQASTPDGQRMKLRLLGPAPRAAAGVAGPSLYYLMAAQDSVPIGTPLQVALVGQGNVTGVLVPAAAVVWHDGQALVFRQGSPGHFSAIAVPTSTPDGRGYFVAEGAEGAAAALRPGQRIVVGGAALVFSASRAAPSTTKTRAAKAEDDDD